MASGIRILVPVDFSGQSVIALEQSYNLARLYDAIVHLVYVVDLPGKVAAAVGLGGEEKRQHKKEEARQKLNQLAEDIRAAQKVPVQTSVVTGKVEQAIVDEANQRWALIDVCVVHRVGRLSVDDQIVFVGVSASHRAEAFQACDFIMDYLKSRAAFWKKETQGAKSHWVEANEKDQHSLARWSK